MSFEWFRSELRNLMPNGDLRLVREPHRLGVDLWVVERRVSAKEHAERLECLRVDKMPRYYPLFIAGIGDIQYDIAPEWAIAHVCKSESCGHQPPQFSVHDPQCYREPNSADIAALRRWLFEFRDFQHCVETLQRERRERQEKLDKEENLIIRKDIKSSKKFRQLRYSFAGDGESGTTERIDENVI